MIAPSSSGGNVKRDHLGCGALIGLLLFCAADGSVAQTEEPASLPPAFGHRSLYVLHIPILGFAPADTAAVPPGTSTWSLETAYANSFSHSWHAPKFHEELGPPGTRFRRDEAEEIHRDFPRDTVWFVDGEVLRTGLAGRFGLAPSWVLSLEIPYLSHRAFSGDGFIQGFHRVVGLGQAGRSDFPKGRFVVMLQQAGGDAVAFDDRALHSGWGDLTTTLSWRPARSAGSPTFGLDVAVKAPTGSPTDYNGSGGWDGGLLLFVARPGQRSSLSAEASVVFPGRWKAPVSLSTSPFGRVLVSAARLLGSRTWVGVSVAYEQSPFRGEQLGDVSSGGMEVAVGVERQLQRRWATRLTVTEHMPRLGDRADVGLGLRVLYR